MPEEGIETQELKEKLEEAAESAEGKREEKATTWILPLSLSTALIAVFAAIGSLESGAYANEAIVQKDEAILQQSKADDTWAYYQAKGIKASFYTTQADLTGGSNPEAVEKLREAARKEKDEQQELSKQAKEHESKVEESGKESEHSLHIHHRFATSVTIFQIAIALAAIAALTKKKPMWFVSLLVGAGGLFYFARGFLALL
jgi:hypothetical protein